MSKMALPKREGKNGLFSKQSWHNWVSTWKEGRRKGRDRGREEGVHFSEILAHMHWETCMGMFIAALLIIS